MTTSSAKQLYARAAAAFNQRDWHRVAALASALSPIAAHHAGAQYIIGTAWFELGNMVAAAHYLNQAAKLAPSHVEIVVQYARALAALRAIADARNAADRARALASGNATALDQLGAVYSDCGDHFAAVECHRGAAAAEPGSAVFQFNLATALMHVGDLAAAEQAVERALACDPKMWRAHLARSNLRKQTATSEHTVNLRALLDLHGNDREAQICLHFALAKECEDLEDYLSAFRHYRAGNIAAGGLLNYTPAQDEAIFGAMHRAFPDPSPPAATDVADEPIFVFGLPRSGTSLVAQILSSHPDVQSAGESLQFGMAVGRAWNDSVPFWQAPDIATRVKSINWRQPAADYVHRARPPGSSRQHFVDKFPFNFLYAGFIAHGLPAARMICVRRNPMDTCLANFRQLFAEKLPYYHYSFDIESIGHYYIMFDQLMKHWREVLPGRILEVGYEDLVDNQEAETRRLLNHCGLSWHADCLHFERHAGPIATASSLQVRQPLYRSAIGFWHHYASELEPLHAKLTAAGINPDAQSPDATPYFPNSPS